MDVSLTEAQRRFVEAKVAAGEFASAEELVLEAVDLLMGLDRREAGEPVSEYRFTPEDLAAIEEGYQEALRGETVDGHGAFAEIQARIESLIRERGLDASD
ncbi:MAG TPA: hypothetical protein VJP77_06065 [Planctomycetota bacterium]|nr:hypothetical protein [Planctomycetota bacterium]